MSAPAVPETVELRTPCAVVPLATLLRKEDLNNIGLVHCTGAGRVSIIAETRWGWKLQTHQTTSFREAQAH